MHRHASCVAHRVITANLVLPFFFGLTVGMGLFLTLFICNAIVRRKWIAAILTLLRDPWRVDGLRLPHIDRQAAGARDLDGPVS